MSNPDPTVTNLSLTLGSLGTYNATVTTWEMVADVTMAAQGFTFPTGRWLVTLVIAGFPADKAPVSVVSQQDITLGSPGTITVPAETFYHLRDFTQARSVQVQLTVSKRSGSLWVPFASTGANNGIVALPAAAAGTVPPFGAASEQVFGPLTNFQNYPIGYLQGAHAAIKAAGGTITRNDTQWMQLCPTSAAFDATIQAAYDAYFTSCATNGLKAIVYLCPIISSPAWAATSGVRGNPPASWSDYSTFVSNFLARWGTNIAAVAMINEPNLYGSIPNGTAALDAPTYVGLLQHTYSAVKAASPTMPVLAGSLSLCDTTYLASLYAQAGFKGNYDAIDIHPYSVDFFQTPPIAHDPSIAQSAANAMVDILPGLMAVHKMMRDNSEGTVPIWVVECGWNAGVSGAGKTYNAYDVSEAQQAAFTAYALRALARLGYVNVANFYAARDTSPNAYLSPNSWGWSDYWGNRQKPVVAALAAAKAAP
ncbi:MAG: cellulase family glycosylhydrolase [Candidatus Saccharibacteria bacterium]|nr:cellulase family glycosylhydrolase [Candidatus Saccharibacteria bacterium]